MSQAFYDVLVDIYKLYTQQNYDFVLMFKSNISFTRNLDVAL